jgi:hypothetical protein
MDSCWKAVDCLDDRLDRLPGLHSLEELLTAAQLERSPMAGLQREARPLMLLAPKRPSPPVAGSCAAPADPTAVSAPAARWDRLRHGVPPPERSGFAARLTRILAEAIPAATRAIAIRALAAGDSL